EDDARRILRLPPQPARLAYADAGRLRREGHDGHLAPIDRAARLVPVRGTSHERHDQDQKRRPRPPMDRVHAHIPTPPGRGSEPPLLSHEKDSTKARACTAPPLHGSVGTAAATRPFPKTKKRNAPEVPGRSR